MKSQHNFNFPFHLIGYFGTGRHYQGNAINVRRQGVFSNSEIGEISQKWQVLSNICYAQGHLIISSFFRFGCIFTKILN